MQPKILLVDDREDNLISIESVLAPAGYKFVKANSGREALRILLHEVDFTMILMDVKMPDLSGFETAQLINEREKLRHIPIIFITANTFGDENVFKGYRLGAIDYIYKPVNPEVLRAKVGVLVELYRKNLQLSAQERKLSIANRNLEIEIREHLASEERIVQLNTELLKKVEELENANKSLDRFAFMACHDLQEPLRKIRIFIDRVLWWLDQNNTDGAKSDLKRVQRSAERMQSLIADILTFSKVSETDVEMKDFDMNEVITEVLNEMTEEISASNAQIIVDPLPYLRGSPTLIRPLFQNLIGNAIKYARKKVNPVVRIYSEGPEQPEGLNGAQSYIRILVEDNGIGFEAIHAEEIFEMFKRLHPADQYEGTGIGLALCKKIVEQHKGFITARSKPNEGSTFIVAFPVHTGKPTPILTF